MAFKLKNLKEVENRTKCLIFGYAKKIKPTLATCNLFQAIPQLITSTCILYYFETDKFLIKDPYSVITLLNKGKTFRKHAKNSSYSGLHCITGQVMLSTSKPLNCKWTIKIDDFNDNGYGSIGVVAFNPNKALCRQTKFGGFLYSYLTFGGHSYKNKSSYKELKKYGEPFVADDIIQVHLIINKDKQQLSFACNGENLGLAFDDLKFGENIYYRLKVAVYDCNDQMTLLNFKTH